jgi:hypothetical protein
MDIESLSFVYKQDYFPTIDESEKESSILKLSGCYNLVSKYNVNKIKNAILQSISEKKFQRP